jgi:hypothetical protein
VNDRGLSLNEQARLVADSLFMSLDLMSIIRLQEELLLKSGPNSSLPAIYQRTREKADHFAATMRDLEGRLGAIIKAYQSEAPADAPTVEQSLYEIRRAIGKWRTDVKNSAISPSDECKTAIALIETIDQKVFTALYQQPIRSVNVAKSRSKSSSAGRSARTRRS